MQKINVEMPPVRKCRAASCGYNVNQNCHARAITVGDAVNPDCDTFFQNDAHSRETRRIAGVGACKVSGCRYNDDFECTAESIEVGLNGREVRCLTFAKR